MNSLTRTRQHKLQEAVLAHRKYQPIVKEDPPYYVNKTIDRYNLKMSDLITAD